MSSLVPVSKSLHANKSWAPRKGYAFAANRQIIPILRAEIAAALPHYALGFVPDANLQYQLVALVGIGGERNLYTTEDMQWLASYVPAELRKYPFAVAADSQNKPIFCIEQSALSDDDTQPKLFDKQGNLDPLVKEKFSFVVEIERDRQATLAIVKAVADANLIEPWNISINRENQDPISIRGIFRIREEAILELDQDSLTRLHKIGALPLIYAQIFSTRQLSQLKQRADYLSKSSTSQINKNELKDILTPEDSGTINFDALG